MTLLKDLIKDTYTPPIKNPSKAVNRLEKSLDDFVLNYNSHVGQTFTECYLTEYNNILDALQDSGYVELVGLFSNGVRKIVEFKTNVWEECNPKWLRVVNKVEVEYNIDFDKPITSQDIVLTSVTPFDTLVAMKYIQKQLNAKERGLEFNLTLADMKHLLSRKTCYYSGIKLTLDGDTAMSLDRVDDSKGYVKGNVVACASIVNKAKNEMLEKKLFGDMTSVQIKQMLLRFIELV